MNRFRIWWLYVLTGRYGHKTFNHYIDKLRWHAYHQTLNQLTTFDQAVWSMPEVQAYFIFGMKHNWQAALAGGGAGLKIPNSNRRDAIAYLMKVAPRACVMHIDDVMKIIFYKVTE